MHANQIPTEHKVLFFKKKLIIFYLKFKNQKKVTSCYLAIYR